MSESVYKVVELIGTSTESWEKAAAKAVETASKSLRDLRIAGESARFAESFVKIGLVSGDGGA